MNNELTQLKMDITELKTDVKNIVVTQQELKESVSQISKDLKAHAESNTEMFMNIMNKKTEDDIRMARDFDSRYARKEMERAFIWAMSIVGAALIGYILKVIFSHSFAI